MKNNYPKLDPKTGRFLPLKDGEKPPKMLIKENELGTKFEEDYKKLYLLGEMGQKKFSKRWGVSNRSLIFGKNLRGGRRSWVQMLKLDSYTNSGKDKVIAPSLTCEVCGVSDISLDNAHWVENKNGGSTKYFNVLKLCPNCHRKLDGGDQIIVKKARASLLMKVVERILNSSDKKDELELELLTRVEPIVLHRR